MCVSDSYRKCREKNILISLHAKAISGDTYTDTMCTLYKHVHAVQCSAKSEEECLRSQSNKLKGAKRLSLVDNGWVDMLFAAV